MIRFCYTLLIIFACCYHSTAADNAGLLWNKATMAYRQKHYDSAIAFYEQIAAGGSVNANLYYNLGNSYYKDNKIADAVLNYERSLFLDPDNKQAADNLLLTQNRITNRIQAPSDIFFIRWWQSITSSNHATAWALISLICFLLLIGGLLLRRMGNLVLPAQAYFFTGVFTLAFMFIAFTAASNKAATDKAVVMEEHAPLRPEDQGGKQSFIPQGTTVSVSGVNGKLANVTLPDGRSGWMQLSDLTYVQPGKH